MYTRGLPVIHTYLQLLSHTGTCSLLRQCTVHKQFYIFTGRPHSLLCSFPAPILAMAKILARDAQGKLALIVAQCLSIHLSICVSVRDSSSHAYVRSIARREPPRLPACASNDYNEIVTAGSLVKD